MLMTTSKTTSRERRAFALISFILWTFFAASSVPTPLYQVYQSQFEFSSITLTVIYATYAFGMLIALLVMGSLSDYLGRKPVILAAIALEVTSMVAFLIALDGNQLIIARLIQGIATGLATAVLGAYLMDLDSPRAAVTNTIIPMTGTGSGVLISSAMVDFGPHPLHTTFAAMLAVFIAQFLCVLFLDEPIARRIGALRSLKPKLALPENAKGMFMAIMPMNTAVWSLNGFFLALVPSLVRVATESKAALTAGIVVGLMSFLGAVSTKITKPMPPERAIGIGAVLLFVGVIGILSGVHQSSIGLFYLSTVAAGLGAGACFSSFARMLLPLAPPEQRASLISAYYVASQCSLIIPSISIGVLIRFVGLPTGTYYYAGFVMTLLALSSLLMAYQKRVKR